MTNQIESPQQLWNRNFTLVIIGQIVSLFGNAILRFALPLYLLRETGSAAIFGAVTAVAFLPMILLSFLGGVLADRVNKRNIMVILDFLTAIIITIFSIALGHVSLIPLMIIVLMCLYGISGSYHPTVQASIPLLVGKDHVLKANAIVNQVGSLSMLMGPIIGGIVFGASGLGPILIISIVCFTLSAIMEIFIQIPYTKRETEQGIIAIIRTDLHDSIHFITKEKPTIIKLFMVVAAHNAITSSMVYVGIPILIINTLELSDALLGYAQGAIALGGLIGGMLVMIFSRSLKLSYTQYTLFASSGLVLSIAIALLLDGPKMIIYMVIVLACIGIMLLFTMFGVQMMAHLQTEVPSELVGKIIALLLSIVMIAQPIGQAVIGLVFEAFSENTAIIVLVIAVVSTMPAFMSRIIYKK